MGLIQKLSADVVNRIAAGEVVQRPSAALKELLENALDAGSGSIQVSAGEGGLQSLEVSDDGSGIFKDDLPLLCERYATSKLRCFEDLQQVASFGFRGEALASLSYVSRVTVVTRRRDSDAAKGSHVAWRCRYMDGKLLGEGEGDGGGAQACAGNFGTTIRAEKMFYNAAVRRQAIRPSEEWGRIVDVVGRYALAFPHVAFSCKREGGSSSASAQSLAFPRDSTVLKNIRIMFGNAVASHLRLIYYYKDHQGDENRPLLSTSTVDSAPASCEVSVKPLGDEDILTRVRQYSNTLRSSSVHGSTEEAYSIAGYTSDATLANRKTFLCVFVNQRLVESSAIRRAVDSAYAAALAGTGNKPFTVLFLTVPAQRVDVNVHPTKQEVCLLDEELILARLVELIRGALLAAAGSRQMDWMKMSSTAVVALKEFERKGGGGAEGGSGCPQMESSSLPVLRQLQTDMRVNGNHGLLPNQPASVVPPSMTIRVEPQKGALDRFFHSRAGVEAVGSGTEDAAPVPLPHNDKERCDCESSEDESEKQEVGLLSKSGVEAHSVNTLPPTITGLIPSVPTVLNLDEEEEEDDVMGDFKRFRREGPASSAPGGEEWAAAPESPSQQQDGTTADGMDLNGTEGMRSTLGVSSIVEVPELEDQVLTSVAAIAEEIQQSSNATAELLVRELSFVGVLDRHSCLAQSGTNLLLLDLRSMAREVVYQRIFLRWVDPTLPKAGSVQMQPPLALQELLFAALQHDSDAMTPHSDELAAVLCEMRVGGGMDACSDQTACSLPPKTSTYLRRLSRRLCRWREMLAEYYGIVLSSEGFLLKLPYGMNSSWHPFLRAVPLLMWMLAERVPYPRSGDGAVVEEGSPLSGVEAKCFKSIAAHISDVLYGLQTPSIAGLPDGSPVLSDAVQFGLLPCLRNQSLFAAPAAWLHDGTIQPVVSVDSLYKVFERC